MLKKLVLSVTFLSLFSLSSISYAKEKIKLAEAPLLPTQSAPNLGGITGTGYQPSFIKAADLLKKMQKKEKVVIVDVRGKGSYDESHIQGAVLKELSITADAAKSIPKDALIVTYCGCPHHLSSIGAEQLTNLGYKNVKVLDEGFIYWKDHNMPLSKISKSPITQMSVAGFLLKNKKPLANVDIYLRHDKTGQMEATRTNKDGSYKMNFHLYNYVEKDNFKFYVTDLKKPIQNYSTNKKENKNVTVNIR